jgi:glyceraldehyde 3-phosphate dehydrogenase
MSIRIAINGLGRIGRCFLRAHSMMPLSIRKKMPIVAINTGSPDVKSLIHLLKYDSTHGIWERQIKDITSSSFDYGDGEILLSGHRNLEEINWKKLKVDVVLECSGIFNDVEKVSKHITAGAQFVLVSAPCKNCQNTVILSVNDELLQTISEKQQKKTHINKKDKILSIGSCTTNAFVPILYPLHNNIGIEGGFITTVHAYTGDQKLLDGSHKDKRRGRSAACSIIPTSTGVGKLIGTIIPELEGKIGAAAMRVPVPNVSLIDFSFKAKRDTSVDEINNTIKAAEKKHPNIISVTEEELVSIDFNHTTHSSIFDTSQTAVCNKRFCRIVSWYDNEWGFVHRMLDTLTKIGPYIA